MELEKEMGRHDADTGECAGIEKVDFLVKSQFVTIRRSKHKLAKTKRTIPTNNISLF
jgi:hypothetical protein